MGIWFKPHLVSVETAGTRMSGDDVGGVNYAAPVNVPCQVTPGKASLVYETFNLELNNPYLLMTDPEHEPKFTVGTKVTYSGKVLIVKASETFEAGTIGANLSVVLQEREEGA
jgi:hypothetical protein